MDTRSYRPHLKQLSPVALLALVPAIALVFSGEYLLFHTVSELFVAAVALVVFSIAWHTRRVALSDYVTFIGMASLPFGVVILLHTLSYRGMPTFPLHDTDLPTQLWLIARVIQTSAFLIAPYFATRKLRSPAIVLLSYSLVTAIAVIGAMAGLMPAAFIEGQGLTPFKVWTEYAVIAGTLVAAAGLYTVRKEVHPYVRTMLWLAMALIVVAELSFTLYTDPFGPWNRVGHVLHVAAFIAIYGALVHSSLEAPFETLFLRLKQREEELGAAYQQEHDIAETLQSAMVVQPTHVEGLDIAHRYLPAKGVGRIGGDFYDIFRLDGDLVGFLIGDVCGKGLRAASTTFRVRSVVHAFALVDPEPSSVLESVNHYLLNDLADGVFVTAVYGTMDTRSGETSFAVAGHPDPVVCGRSGMVVEQKDRATPLGVVQPLNAVTQHVTLSPGEAMVLVTDGVIEAKGSSGLFGLGRLEELLHRLGCMGGTDALLDSVIEAINEFSGSAENDDDVAMLALRFAPRTESAG